MLYLQKENAMSIIILECYFLSFNCTAIITIINDLRHCLCCPSEIQSLSINTNIINRLSYQVPFNENVYKQARNA